MKKNRSSVAPSYENMPNFLIIGAHKSGTTSLYQYLKQHPQIFMSPVKEPHFFSFLDHPLDFNDPEFNPATLQSYSNLREYQALFQSAGDAVAIGEASPSYLYVSQTAVNIHKYLPNAKMIAILRNPVDRAYSNFLHCLARTPPEPLKKFSEALQAEPRRIRDNWSPLWHYQQKGFYAQQISRYYQLFPKEQIRIYLYDAFVSEPQKLLQNVFKFLQVDSNFKPDLSTKHNVSGIPRNILWRTIFNHFRWARPFLPLKLRQLLKGNTLTRPPMPLAARKQLAALYKEDILQLQDLTQRDLTHWFAVE